MNMVGMEGGYGVSSDPKEVWPQAQGPVAGSHYPVYTTELMDYYVQKGFMHVRLVFSWDRLQSELWGAVPAAGKGYQIYFGHLQRMVDHLTGQGVTVLLEPWQADPSGGAGGARWRGQPVGIAAGEVDMFAFADFWGKMAAIFKANPRVEYGLVNEPHDMSTMVWWETAQKCIDYIRAAGATTRIYVEGNGWSGAGSWRDNWYDQAPAGQPQRSNAYGWLNANGPGQPLWDPLHNTAAEVHVYFDEQASGQENRLVDAARRLQRLSPAVEEGSTHGYQVIFGEFAVWAEESEADAAVDQLATYLAGHQPTCLGAMWWASGDPEWWPKQQAPNYALTHYDSATNSVEDTVNMKLLLKHF